VLLYALPHQLMSGVTAGALLARFESDAAAFQAKQPKLPKKGQRNILVRANSVAVDCDAAADPLASVWVCSVSSCATSW
jgi:hypothetical protein